MVRRRRACGRVNLIRQRRWRRAQNNSHTQAGQTTIEYILMMAVVLGIVMGMMTILNRDKFFFKQLVQPIVSYMRYNYKYGDHNALGWDEGGGPRKHIQISEPGAGETFRLFVPEN